MKCNFYLPFKDKIPLPNRRSVSKSSCQFQQKHSKHTSITQKVSSLDFLHNLFQGKGHTSCACMHICLFLKNKCYGLKKNNLRSLDLVFRLYNPTKSCMWHADMGLTSYWNNYSLPRQRIVKQPITVIHNFTPLHRAAKGFYPHLPAYPPSYPDVNSKPI